MNPHREGSLRPILITFEGSVAIGLLILESEAMGRASLMETVPGRVAQHLGSRLVLCKSRHRRIRSELDRIEVSARLCRHCYGCFIQISQDQMILHRCHAPELSMDNTVRLIFFLIVMFCRSKSPWIDGGLGSFSHIIYLDSEPLSNWSWIEW